MRLIDGKVIYSQLGQDEEVNLKLHNYKRCFTIYTYTIHNIVQNNIYLYSESANFFYFFKIFFPLVHDV